MVVLWLLVLAMLPKLSSSFSNTMRRPLSFVRMAYSSELSGSGYTPDYSRFKEVFPEVSSHQWDLLTELAVRLHDWNSKINLVSRKDVINLVPSHIVPCMTMAKVKQFGSNERVIDIGTGGGLPGLPMAILNPQSEFTLLDSVGKKLVVVEDIRKSLQLDNVRVVNARAEDHAAQGHRYDVLLGRAVSNLPHFLSFTCDLISDSSGSGGGLYYLKGGEFSDEIKNAGIDGGACTTHRVQRLAKGAITSDKNVLFVPAAEVVAFQSRKDGVVEWLAQQRKREKRERDARQQ